MKLEDFHRLVSYEVRRGTSLDAYIPAYVKQSVNLLERNAPMKWMEEIVKVVLHPGEQQVDMQWNFRNWRWIRYARAGKWAYLDYRNPREEEFVGGPTDEVIPTPEGPAINGPPFSPATWSQVGVRFIRFNHSWNGPGDLELQGMVYKYSDWQQTKADFRHYLLDVASDLLLYQTMLRIASSIKDTRLRDMYLPLREDALKTVMNADQDAEYGEARDDHMEYTGIYR